MKISIIVFNEKQQKEVVYLTRIPNKIKLSTWLRFKSIIYNKIFTYYHKDMDFSNSKILINNR